MSGLNEALKQARKIGLSPPPDLTVSEWADMYRQLSPEASSQPGKWRTEFAEYQRGIMDALNDNDIDRVVCMTSAQVGKTEIELNMIGYYMHQDPSPMLVVYPTEAMAMAFSNDRLSTMIRDTEVLKPLVSNKKTQNTTNTKLHKQFPGGHITMVGSNSPSNLAGRPIRVVVFDEVDRFPASAGGEKGEGDIIALAEKRTRTFLNRKIIMVSTPTIRGLSRIEQAYEESDKRRYFVPCPHCDEMSPLEWSMVNWNRDDDGTHRPETASICCKSCGALWGEKERRAAVRKGEWRITGNPGRTAGFHLNELYSPWSSLEDIVREFLLAKQAPERLKAWINTSLGETFEEQGDSIDSGGLIGRRENYDKVPSKVGVLVCSVDVQDDRLEYLLAGFGDSNEVWGIQHGKIYGDPALDDVWNDLDDITLSRYEVEDGTTLPVAITMVDTGGNKTQDVYQQIKRRQGRRFYGLKGSSQLSSASRPLIASISKNNSKRVTVFNVSVDTGKDTLFARLNIDQPGPAYIHFNRSFTEEFFLQFAAEKRVIRYHKGFRRREYKKVAERNEAIDLFVYAFAGFEVLNVRSIEKLVEQRMKRTVIEEEAEEIKEPSTIKRVSIRPKKQKNNFAKNW